MKFRDSWNVWREKVNKALGGLSEPIEASDVVFDKTGTTLTATDVESAIKELNTADGTMAESISTISGKVTALEGKKYKLTKLFEGNASAGGSSGVEVTVASVDAFDELLIYYNAGNQCANIPVALIKVAGGNLLRVKYIDGETTVSATVKYVSDTSLVVNASQASTMYLYGIQYHA